MAAYNTAFGSLPGYNEMLGKSNTTGGGVQQQTPGAQRPRRMRPPGQAQEGYQNEQTQPRQTFAQMQQQGQARPAPAPMGGGMGAPSGAPPQGGFGRTPQAQDLQGQLQRSLSQGLAQPSAYNTDTFNQLRSSQAANLQAEYTGQKQALDEELAARGLYASSIGGGRMGDLAGQQARAMSSLDAQLLQQFATTQAADRLAAQRAAQEYATQQQTTALKAGELTGSYGGQDTLAAREMANQKALQEAALTGRYGGQQTLASQQQTESQRQFNVQQALAAQLGLGNLSVAQQEVGIKQQALSQQAADAAAERTLRDAMQTRELTAQEKTQLNDITARKELQTQQISATQAESAAERDIRLRLQSGQITAEQAQQERQIASQQALQSQQISATQAESAAERDIRLRLQSGQITAEQAQQERSIASQEKLSANQLIEQGRQFGLQLDETKANRLQQYGISTQELGIKSQALQQEAALQGRQMSITEAQNAAQNTLERDRITNQAAQFGLQLNETIANRVQQAGFTGQELGLKAQQIADDARLRGQSLSQEQTQNLALNSMENQRIQNQMSQFTSSQSQQQAQFMTEQTGTPYVVKDGQVVQRDTNNPMSTMDKLRYELQVGQLKGFVGGTETVESRSATAQQKLAENQLLMSLTQVLSGLDPNAISQLLGKKGTGPTTTVEESDDPLDGATDGAAPTGGKYTRPGGTYTDRFGKTWVKQLDKSWVLKTDLGNTGGDNKDKNTPDPILAALGAASPEGKTGEFGGKKYKAVGGKWVEDTTLIDSGAPKEPTTPSTIIGYGPDGQTIMTFTPGGTTVYNGQTYRNIPNTNNWVRV